MADTQIDVEQAPGRAACGRSARRQAGKGSKKRFRDLPGWQRRLVVLLGTVEVGMALAAFADLARCPAEEVRGPKWAWVPVIAVNIVGPLAWFRFGRRPKPLDALGEGPGADGPAPGGPAEGISR